MKTNHISVCICTFRRPELLKHLLERLANQRTDGLFTYSVVVADNDSSQSAKAVVTEFGKKGSLAARYCSEPVQNIALARNKSIENADGDLIAFIDDDEFPADDWLFNMFRILTAHQADGVLGPVRPYFDQEPPRWVKDGRFFDRPEYPTGYKMNWSQTRSGNVLFLRRVLTEGEPPFRSQFSTAGEDVDFFRRKIEEGRTFLWCNEGVAYELVPSSRCKWSYLLRRALLRGSNFSKHPSDRLINAAKSLVAVPCYTIALPVLVFFGQHVFLKYLIKLLDHTSRLFSYLGLPLVTERQN